MASIQLQSRIRSFHDYISSDQGPHCLTSLMQNPKAQYLPDDMSIMNTVDKTSRTKNSGSIFFGDRSFDISNGTMQVLNEINPSPEQVSSITYCSDGEANSDSGFVDGGPNFHDSCMRLAYETPIQNYVHHSHFTEGNLISIKHGNFSDLRNTRSPSIIFGGKPKAYFSDLHMSQMDSQGLPEPLDISPSSYTDIPRTPPEEIVISHLKEEGSEQNDFSSRIDDSEHPYFLLDKPHCFETTFSSDTLSILLGPTDASKFSDLNEETLQKDLLSYANYKRMHIDGNEVSFVQYMHSTVCDEWTCNCDRFVLVFHYENCHFPECNICEPVRRIVSGKPPMKTKIQKNSHLVVPHDRELTYTEQIPAENGHLPRKRVKSNSSISFDKGAAYEVSPSLIQNRIPEQQQWLQHWPETPFANNLGTSNFGTGVSSTFENPPDLKSAGNDVVELADGLDQWNSLIQLEELSTYTKNVDLSCKGYGRVAIKGSDQEKADLESDLTSLEADPEIKKSQPKIMGVSLIDFFTEKEVKEHLSSRCLVAGQERGEALVGSTRENTCRLCFMDKLSFASTPVYCSCCGALIKLRLLYYNTIDEMGIRHSFCTRCFKASRGGDISFHGLSISKQKLQKQINNHVDDESWVQCDKCKGWQHQICALYNDKRDLGGKIEYVCPRCYLVGIEVGDYTPLSGPGAFKAKELPTTLLSDHIEHRLFIRLKEERKERAKALQMNYEEVPGASDLVVRVVLSVSKLLNVKQQFLDIIPDEKYPTEFPFKSKVILLFQKIEGVDVCLFGFYVQEFGSECGHPNQRSVYISYLDSVKYFRPEIKTTSGEALRTMVYHEILIGYLEYCKKQGFATCYIWACPPMKGEDYILYCHPVSQKTPKSDKLRHWYKSMLRKASQEEITVNCTNLHDNFFVPTGERDSKITVARLPYFDGDYWSVSAMDIIQKIELGGGVGSPINTKKVLTKRTLKSMGHSNVPGDVMKDILVMQKLGQTISPVKEDFIIVRLQFTCTSCHEIILSGSRWFCDQCKSIHLCSRCQSKMGNTHTSIKGEIHALSQATVNDVPADTDDRDVILDNSYLEYRHSFLSFCQGNHFQFDELRRAKHSSMMILYHLHNSTVKSVEATCRMCDQKILVNQGWHCITCSEFNICDGCYRKQGGNCHVHQLTQHSSLVNRGSGSVQAPPHQLLRSRGVMEGLLRHASQCMETKSSACPYPNCSQIRKLWCHSHQCSLRVAGRCQLCQKTWALLRLHSENCRDSGCRVPRCMDLKKHLEMLALQSDARRSAAVLGSLRGI